MKPRDFFTRTTQIPANLRSENLLEIMDIRDLKDAYQQDSYLKKKYSDQHFLVGYAQTRSFESDIHEFKYDAKNQVVQVKSWCEPRSFIVYLFGVMFLAPLFGENPTEKLYIVLLGIIGWIVVITIILKLGLISKAKEIERELHIRLNVKKMLLPNSEK